MDVINPKLIYLLWLFFVIIITKIILPWDDSIGIIHNGIHERIDGMDNQWDAPQTDTGR